VICQSVINAVSITEATKYISSFQPGGSTKYNITMAACRLQVSRPSVCSPASAFDTRQKRRICSPADLQQCHFSPERCRVRPFETETSAQSKLEILACAKNPPFFVCDSARFLAVCFLPSVDSRTLFCFVLTLSRSTNLNHSLCGRAKTKLWAKLNVFQSP
jgi:hypothetical protein